VTLVMTRQGSLVTLDAVLRRPPGADTGELSPALHAGDLCSVAARQEDTGPCAPARPRRLRLRPVRRAAAAALLASCVTTPPPSTTLAPPIAAPDRLGLPRRRHRPRSTRHLRPRRRRHLPPTRLAGRPDRHAVQAAPTTNTTADVAAQLSALSDAETDASVRDAVARSISARVTKPRAPITGT
jgi:hypothetical protein